MKPVKPVYVKLLIIIVIAWVISTTFYTVNLYLKVGKIEHALVHMAPAPHR